MANEKFTQLPTVSNANTSDIIAAVQAGVSVQETLGQIAILMRNNIILSYSGDPNGNVAGSIYQLCWDTVNEVLYVCTTSGTALTATWTLAGSLTIPVPMAQGGTGKALTAANGGIVYSDADSMEILAATATAGQMFRSGSNAAPSWSTATFPATTTVSQLLYSSSANVVGGLATANSSSLVTNSTGVPSWSSTMTNGQLIIGSTSATPAAATLTAGANISISNGAGSITISSTGGGGYVWSEVTGTSQAMAVDNGYVANNAALVSLSLPTSSAVGDSIAIIGKGAGGWIITQGANQLVHIGSAVSTTGTGGSVASTNQYDSLELICTVANLEWTILGAPQGSLTVV